MSHQNQSKTNQKRKRSKKSKFESFFKKGIFLRSSFFDVWFLPKEESAERCIHVVVRKKVSKKATDRNLWRRRIKEMIRKETSFEESVLFKVRAENKKAPSTKKLLESWESIFEKYRSLKKVE